MANDMNEGGYKGETNSVLCVSNAYSDLKNPFEYLPKDISYKILACCDWKECEWKDLLTSKAVCKEWYNMLSLSAIQAIASSYKSKSLSRVSPSFLVKISYQLKNTDDSNLQEKTIFVSIDHEGRCENQSMLNSMNLDLNPSFEITSNGFIFVFSALKNYGQILVINPSYKRLIPIPCEIDPSFTSEDLENSFKGAHYDPSTSQFSLIIGFIVNHPENLSYHIQIYRSESQQWKSITCTMSRGQCFQPYYNTAIFSEGCYLWLENVTLIEERGVMAFSLVDEQFHRISLPECPLLARIGHGCFQSGFGLFGDLKVVFRSWYFKGCEGNVVLFHSPYGMDYKANGLVAWKLLKTESEWEWKQLGFQINNQKERSYAPSHFYFDTNNSRSWLWVEINMMNAKPSDLRILDEHGEVSLTIPMSNLLSAVGIQDSQDCSAIVTGVWSFETNDIWRVLAAS